MFRLLIVDDEPVIVNSLGQLLQSSGLEVEVSRAYHAYEALDLMRSKRIDLIISDIRMPGLSGIELQKRVMERWPHCRMIFLTGYNQFEYAQEAIRNGGVLDYMLKHQDDDAIIDTVANALAQIENNRQIADRALETAARLQEAMLVLQQQLLTRILAGELADAETIARELERADIRLDTRHPVLLVYAQPDVWDDKLTRRDRELLLYACANIMEEYLTDHTCRISVPWEEGLAWLIQPLPLGEAAWQELRSRLPDIVEAVQEACDKWLKLSISFAINCEAGSLTEAGARLAHLRKLFPSGTGRRKQWLIRDMDFADQHDDDDKEGRGSRIVQQIQQFIEARLHEDLSLSRLAGLVHHSPTYLSRLYKQTTGEALFDYIADRRLGMAKQLLKGSNMKIYEIAEKIGYESAPHFTRFFKKRYGITPQEFRDR